MPEADCSGNYDLVSVFFGNDYFCESGLLVLSVWRAHEHIFYPDDVLWDGQNCIHVHPPTHAICSQPSIVMTIITLHAYPKKEVIMIMIMKAIYMLSQQNHKNKL